MWWNSHPVAVSRIKDEQSVVCWRALQPTRDSVWMTTAVSQRGRRRMKRRRNRTCWEAPCLVRKIDRRVIDLYSSPCMLGRAECVCGLKEDDLSLKSVFVTFSPAQMYSHQRNPERWTESINLKGGRVTVCCVCTFAGPAWYVSHHPVWLFTVITFNKDVQNNLRSFKKVLEDFSLSLSSDIVLLLRESGETGRGSILWSSCWRKRWEPLKASSEGLPQTPHCESRRNRPSRPPSTDPCRLLCFHPWESHQLKAGLSPVLWRSLPEWFRI